MIEDTIDYIECSDSDSCNGSDNDISEITCSINYDSDSFTIHRQSDNGRVSKRKDTTPVLENVGVVETWWGYWNYDYYKYNPIPENFRLSKENLNALNWFNLWFYGNKDQKIRPLYLIESKKLHIEDRHNYSKGKKVMHDFCTTIMNNFPNDGPHVNDDVRRITTIIAIIII